MFLMIVLAAERLPTEGCFSVDFLSSEGVEGDVLSKINVVYDVLSLLIFCFDSVVGVFDVIIVHDINLF